jgi:hypothetical protein
LGVQVVGAIAMTIWAYLSGTLPGWALALVFLMTLAALSALAYWGAGAVVRLRSAVQPSMTPIDREALADDIERLGRDLARLLGDHAARAKIAWEKDTAR